MTPEPGEVLRLRIRSEQDVFLARQRGRELAALAGFENQDQVRLATALSELTRELAGLADPATVVFLLVAAPAPALHVRAGWQGRLAGAQDDRELAAVEGIAAAARLVGSCAVAWTEDGGTVVLEKRLPVGETVDADRLAAVRTAVARSRPVDALDALRSQNHDLLHALDDLRSRQEALIRANAELEETNRGVMALHAELSEELEQTNRGVVALYAELDEASTRLREASESKTRFWANVSHELRTPLNSVLGLSRLLLDPGSEPLTAEQHHQVELIHDSGAMLLDLVNELLDVAKAESGQIESHPEPVDLRTLFDELRASMRALPKAPDVELSVEDPVTVGPIHTDPVLLGRILRNLLSNGLKFTERGGVRCRAHADRGAGHLEIEVSDTGIGIPAEHQRRVFEEFHQVPGHLQVRGHGTGLGLPYARRLAGILGGTLELTSQPDRGTTATLRLPLETPAGAGAGFTSVLVVDDDPAFRAVLRGMLTGAEHVREAGDGAEALRAMLADPPDLVLLDLNIPPPDGAAVLEEMRRTPALAGVPVVLVTAADLTTEQRRTLGATAALLEKAHLSPDVLPAAAELAARLAGGTG